MNISPSSFFALALKLVKLRGPKACREMEYRTAINRAYYAVFLDARDLVGLNRERHKAHSRVRRKCRKLQYVGLELSAMIEKLFKLRAKADYRLDQTVSHKDAKDSIDVSRKAMKLIAEAREAKARQGSSTANTNRNDG